MEDVDIYNLPIWSIRRLFGTFGGHLVYFPRFGMLYQEKSGNPDPYWYIFIFLNTDIFSTDFLSPYILYNDVSSTNTTYIPIYNHKQNYLDEFQSG
jgi:hypothetical protein